MYRALRQLPLLILGFLLPGTWALQAQLYNHGELTIVAETDWGVEGPLDNTASGTLFNDGNLYCYGDFNNDGTVDFFDQGFVGFLGATAQQLTGSNGSFFYDLRFDNSSTAVPFQLATEINVDNEVDFNSGIVDGESQGGLLTFGANADHINTTDDSHLDGVVAKAGDNSFDFPIGDNGSYRQATISAPDAVADLISAQYKNENSNTAYPHELKAGVVEQINDTEYWVVEQLSGNSNIVLTLGWDATTSPGFITNADPTSLHIVRWDADLGFWVDEGGIPNATNQTVTTISNVTGYGVFTLATVDTEEVLPGGLVSYNAISPNSNDENDVFRITGIERFPNNTVEIFNRWGVSVYKTRGYNNQDNAFRGFSEGNLTVGGSDPLPTGTYFFVLTYEFSENGSTPQTIRETGFLYINAN